MINEFELENGIEPQGDGDDGKKKAPPEWGARTRFGIQKQPSPEAKSAGHKRKKRNQQLARLLLNRTFAGKIKNGEVEVDSKFRKQLKTYFGLTDEELKETTNEAAIMLRLIGQATADGDTQAATLILERAYGKPKEFIDLDDENEGRPQINITIMGVDVPPIANAEEEPKLLNNGDNSEL